MLIVICGKRGSGKSVFLVSQLYKHYKQGKKIYSNLNVKFPHEKITLSSLLSLNFQNATIGIDEAQQYLDCRTSSSKRNRIISYLIFQSRKRSVDIFFTSQQFHNLDIRLRNNADLIYYCTALKKITKNDENVLRPATTQEIEERNIDLIKIKKFDIGLQIAYSFIFNPKKYFTLFDTDEIIPLEL